MSNSIFDAIDYPHGRHAYDDPNWIVPTHNDMLFYASCPSGFVSLVKDGQNKHSMASVFPRSWAATDDSWFNLMCVRTAIRNAIAAE